MTLRITIVPASTQAGREAIKVLLNSEAKPFIQAVYRNPSKAPLDFVENPRFQAVEGDVVMGSGLDFKTSDAVFYVPPPTYDGIGTVDHAQKAANNVKSALEKARSVKRLVVFSAYGADHDKNIGSIAMNHVSDLTLSHSAPEVVIARTGWFMENWASAPKTLKAQSSFFESFITPVDHKIAMESPKPISLRDIGNIIAQQLLETGRSLSSTPHIINLHGPRMYSALDVKDALECITGKTVRIVPIEPNQLREYYMQAVPLPYARELEEMTISMLPGGLIDDDMRKTENVVRGEIELVDGLRRLVSGETVKARSGAF